MAAEYAGFGTVGQCENADFPIKVLEKHWPDVPRWRDIRRLTREEFCEQTGLRTVDLISGGIPCQPFSMAGKQKGKGDDCYLWPEMLRVIREIKPRWVLCENVPGIMQVAGDTVCQDLERQGYAIGILNFEAAAVGATHRRERIFFVANCDYRRGAVRWNGKLPAIAETRKDGGNHRNRAAEHVTRKRRAFEPCMDGVDDGLPRGVDGIIRFPLEPDIPRITAEIKDRANRLKCLGNAVVPAQVYPILKAIYDIESGASDD